MRLILASASPQRRALLASVGIVPDQVAPAAIDESLQPGEQPQHYVIRMARQKALALAPGTDEICLAADTIVVCGRQILGKPFDANEARRFLKRLSGRRHRVMTAVAVSHDTKNNVRRVASRVKFRRLSEADIASYIQSDEWRGKAGGYAIQGRAAAFIPWISGSYSAIVGLPLAECMTMLWAAGWR